MEPLNPMMGAALAPICAGLSSEIEEEFRALCHATEVDLAPKIRTIIEQTIEPIRADLVREVAAKLAEQRLPCRAELFVDDYRREIPLSNWINTADIRACIDKRWNCVSKWMPPRLNDEYPIAIIGNKDRSSSGHGPDEECTVTWITNYGSVITGPHLSYGLDYKPAVMAGHYRLSVFLIDHLLDVLQAYCVDNKQKRLQLQVLHHERYNTIRELTTDLCKKYRPMIDLMSSVLTSKRAPDTQDKSQQFPEVEPPKAVLPPSRIPRRLYPNGRPRPLNDLLTEMCRQK